MNLQTEKFVSKKSSHFIFSSFFLPHMKSIEHQKFLKKENKRRHHNHQNWTLWAIKPRVFTKKLMTTSDDGKFMLGLSFSCVVVASIKKKPTLFSTLDLIHTESRPSFGVTYWHDSCHHGDHTRDLWSEQSPPWQLQQDTLLLPVAEGQEETCLTHAPSPSLTEAQGLVSHTGANSPTIQRSAFLWIFNIQQFQPHDTARVLNF